MGISIIFFVRCCFFFAVAPLKGRKPLFCRSSSIFLIILFSFFSLAQFAEGYYMRVEIRNPNSVVVASDQDTIVSHSSCPTEGASSLTEVTATCDDYSYDSACCNVEGAYTAHVISDDPDFGSPSNDGVTVYTVNWDANQDFCTCAVGSGRWALGGDINTCCGDDSNEYIINCEGDTGSCTGGDTNACCNQANKCVYDNTCYNHGTTRGSYQCDSGYWRRIGGMCGVVFEAPYLNITLTSGTGVLLIDKNGNALFKCNTMNQNTAPPGSLSNSLIVRQGATDRFAFSTSNCYITGTIQEEASVPSESGNDVVVKNGATYLVSMNSNSHFYLKGLAVYHGASAGCGSGYTCDISSLKCT